MAFMFHTTHEQSYIGHVLAFSLCIGHFKDHSLCSQTHPRLLRQSRNPYILGLPTVQGLIGALVILIILFIGKNITSEKSLEVQKIHILFTF